MSGHKQVTTSTPISTPKASFHNDTLAAINFAQKTIRKQHGSRVPNVPGLDDTVLVKNDSGSDAAALAALGISSPMILPSANEMLFITRTAVKGVALAADYVGKFVVLAEPIASGKIGRGWVSGVCPAKIDIVDADHECADIVDGALKSCESGACQILWKDTGTGAGKAAMLRFGGGVRGLFPVKVTQTGGAAGSKATQCSFTYTVNDLAGNSLGTVMTPAKTRPPLGTMKAPAAASYGTGFFAGGTFVLYDANETLDTSAC